MNYPIFYLICQIKVGFMRLVPFTHFLQSFHNLKCQILCFFSFPSFRIMDFRFFSVYSAQFFLYIFIKNFLFLQFFLCFFMLFRFFLWLYHPLDVCNASFYNNFNSVFYEKNIKRWYYDTFRVFPAASTGSHRIFRRCWFRLLNLLCKKVCSKYVSNIL